MQNKTLEEIYFNSPFSLKVPLLYIFIINTAVIVSVGKLGLTTSLFIWGVAVFIFVKRKETNLIVKYGNVGYLSIILLLSSAWPSILIFYQGLNAKLFSLSVFVLPSLSSALYIYLFEKAKSSWVKEKNNN